MIRGRQRTAGGRTAQQDEQPARGGRQQSASKCGNDLHGCPPPKSIDTPPLRRVCGLWTGGTGGRKFVTVNNLCEACVTSLNLFRNRRLVRQYRARRMGEKKSPPAILVGYPFEVSG